MPRIRALAFNALTFVPGVARIPVVRDFLDRRERGTGGTNSARYCYSVWLRHLVSAAEHGLDAAPKVVAELGPGDSLGTGCAALLSGADEYHAFDVVAHANLETNLQILAELVKLFQARSPIPGDDEFPGISPKLANYAFPHEILTEQRLASALAPERIERIRNSMAHPDSAGTMIRYRVPWQDPSVIENDSVDMILSQAVLEHVDDLDGAYNTMKLWLKKTGFLSHQIDFKCHATADTWNGHWAYSDLMWELVRGRRTWLLNREPHSTHIRLLADTGFQIACHKKIRTPSIITFKQLARRFKSMPEDDLTISGVFIQATKNG